MAAPATDSNRNGRIDGEKEQAVPPGTVYRRHFPEIEEAFHGRFAMEQHPTTDEWGRSIQGKKDVILPAIIRLGHNLGVKVLAEGVETETEAAYLQGKRCDEAQGYYFSPPLPYDEFVRFLKEQHARRRAQELT